MKAIYLGVAAMAMSATGAQAATVVFTTTGPTSTAASQSFTSDGLTATFTGGTYAGTAAAMNAAGANVVLTPTTVRSASTGLGVAGDGEPDQVDSNGANELLQVGFSSGSYRITQVILGKIDGDDTFALFGGNGGVYTRLGFTGPVGSGVTGGLPVVTTSLGNGRYKLDFSSVTSYETFRFGTNNETSDGFSLVSLSVAAVPEPSTWAMLIVGFGLVGGAMRRKAAPAIARAIA